MLGSASALKMRLKFGSLWLELSSLWWKEGLGLRDARPYFSKLVMLSALAAGGNALLICIFSGFSLTVAYGVRPKLTILL